MPQVEPYLENVRNAAVSLEETLHTTTSSITYLTFFARNTWYISSFRQIKLKVALRMADGKHAARKFQPER
jgi:hypothetical protein